jgi:hypothetical protein
VRRARGAGAAHLANPPPPSDRVVGDDDDELQPDFPAPAWVSYVLFGLVFAGAITGMCVMGYLGDRLGRHRVRAGAGGERVMLVCAAGLTSPRAPGRRRRRPCRACW